MTVENPTPYVVQIDLKAIYDQLLVLNTRVELLMSKQLDSDKDVKDHEDRLRALEKARWPLPSAALLVSLASLVLAYLARQP